MTEFYPASPKEALSALYLGQDIRTVPAPAAIIDLAAVRRNCARMLSACDSLDLEWRAHVKTHKVCFSSNTDLSSVLQTEHQLTILTDRRAHPPPGRRRPAPSQDHRLNPRRARVPPPPPPRIQIPKPPRQRKSPPLPPLPSQLTPSQVLYGLPLGPSQIPRLAAAAKLLGPGSISILLDDAAQLTALPTFLSLSGGVVPLAHLKIDMGGRRSGVVVASPPFTSVVAAALAAHAAGLIVLSGLYSHAGHSYGGDSQVAAMAMLRDELRALMAGAAAFPSPAPGPLTLSVGATPTALSIQNMLDAPPSAAVQAAVSDLHAIFREAKAAGHAVEIHAGVYPTLDLQQLAAHSLAASRLAWADIAFTVLAEVCSVYPGRGAGGSPEALVGAGGLALGRETCKAYAGMAMVAPWGRKGVAMPTGDVEAHRGWVVGRFAQEHGILTWTGGVGEEDGLEVGQRVRLWPNHACITSSHFGWYFVVDSSREGREDEVVDVWIKARGW